MSIERRDSAPPGAEEQGECSEEFRLTTDEIQSVQKVIARMVPEHDVADVVQNALFSAYRFRSRFRGESRLKTWLHRIAVNAALMHLRSLRLKEQHFEAGVEIETLEDTRRAQRPDELAADQESWRRVHVALDSLEEADREMFDAYFIRECSVEDLASFLRITVAATKSRINRLREQLREKLRKRVTKWKPAV